MGLMATLEGGPMPCGGAREESIPLHFSDLQGHLHSLAQLPSDFTGGNAASLKCHV